MDSCLQSPIWSESLLLDIIVDLSFVSVFIVAIYFLLVDLDPVNQTLTKHWHLYQIICVLQCIWLCLLHSLQHLCSIFYISLYGACWEAFFEQNERTPHRTPPPRCLCFLCVHLPMINDCSASLTDTATTTTTPPEKQTEKRKES